MSNRLLFCLLIASFAAHAAPGGVLPAFEVHAKVDKKNAQLTFDKGAVGTMSDPDATGGIIGATGDFPGGAVPAYIVFDASVPDRKLMALASFQGKLQGVVQCRRVRLGDSPLFPHLKVAVLAEGCAIKSMNH